jgi:hypothetical protein
LKRDQLGTDASTRQHTQRSQELEFHTPGGIRTPESQHARVAYLLLRPREPRRRLLTINIIYKSHRDFVGDLDVDGITILEWIFMKSVRIRGLC